MHWSKVIIASLASSPSFAQQQQRLGGPELVDHGVEMVSEGKIFDDASEGGWEAGSRNFEVDQQDGADASDEQDIEKNVEDAAVFEPESLPQVDENGFFDLAPHLDPEYLAQLTAADRSGLFGYIGNDVEQVNRRLGSTQCKDKTTFILEIETDSDSPGDNYFKVFYNGNQVMKKGPFSNAAHFYAGMCVPAGELKVEATDSRRDGMRNGSYKVYLDGSLAARNPGSNSWSNRVHTFTMPYTAGAQSSNSNPDPTKMPTRQPSPNPTPMPNSVISGRNTCFETRNDEETDYLAAHNSRRLKYHNFFQKEYRPLQWSQELADESKNYAEELVKKKDLEHDPDNRGRHGENLAKNCGSGSWGLEKTADEVLKRWVDNEHKKTNYNEKLHYTAALWRSTEHVGCGTAAKDMGNGETCRVQVCRYQKPPNCSINQETYLEKMLRDNYNCSPGVPVNC